MPLTPGLHESLITTTIEQALAALDPAAYQRAPQQLDWLDDALTRHVATHLHHALRALPASGPTHLADRVALVTRLLTALGPAAPASSTNPANTPHTDPPLPTRDALLWVAPNDSGLAQPKPPPRPEHGLTHPSLLFNGAQDVSLLHELEREIASADRIDAIVAFLKFTGVRLLEQPLRRFLERGGELRLIASTYVGATEARAVEELAALSPRARVRLAYEEDGTRLHAKAWLFHRASGLSTAYIGSSNLSRSALTDGAEWNVRVTQRTTPALIERFDTAFTQFWAAVAPDYDPAEHAERLAHSLARARGDRAQPNTPAAFLRLDVAPKRHQERVLDALAAERERGHHHNLVVAATGTGKTWVSAFDYARLRRDGAADTLLFVAHRKEILEQSLLVFRTVLQDPGFGELLVDGHRPTRGRHVFASIQSLHRRVLDELAPDAFSMVIVDEFHHAAASSYTALLRHLRPRFLLGLTATPERADGQTVLSWFDHRIAAEIRLWDALDEGLLAPFHYFGVHDPSSAERAWRRGRLDPGVLERVYTSDDARAARILAAVQRYIADPTRMRALGFCVGIGHAQFMARAFRNKGLNAVALHGKTPRDQRAETIRALRAGQLQAVFTVDLFNEGVDLPEVDTVLFLRPTESATIFLQQLGRGLRRCTGKSQLTVLDFVGHVHNDYRYEVRYQAMLGGTRAQTRQAVRRGFPRLPPGCAIQLEEQARETVLAGIRQAVGAAGFRHLAQDLRRLPRATTLADFLRQSGADLTDIYLAGDYSWTELRRRAGYADPPRSDDETPILRRLGRLLHVDDRARIDTWRRWLSQTRAPRIATLSARELALARMLWVNIGERRRPVAELQQELDRLWTFPAVRAELHALLGVLDDRVRHQPRDLGYPTLGQPDAPLCSHGTYTRPEIVAAYGLVAPSGRLRESREGPLWIPSHRTDVFFVTLDKSDDTFTPSIRYADYPIDAHRFHWESQNNTHAGTKVGRRYVHHEERGSRVLILVRERPKDPRRETMAFTSLGFARYLSHQGARPMQIIWQLERAIPPALLAAARAIA